MADASCFYDDDINQDVRLPVARLMAAVYKARPWKCSTVQSGILGPGARFGTLGHRHFLLMFMLPALKFVGDPVRHLTPM